MTKKEEFKNFVSNHPNLVNLVKDKSHSWQDLFEVYDLYGDDENLWSKYLNNSTQSTSASSLSELTKLFKNVDIDNVKKYIDTAQKAIGVISELTGAKVGSAMTKVGPTSPRPINKIFED